MSTPPAFRKQASVWSLSDGCYVIPQYGDTNPDLIPPLIAQARAMLVTSDDPLQIVATKKFIANGPTAAATNTGCPTGDVPPPNNPLDDAVVKCQSQPPYTDALPMRLTVVSSPGATQLVPTDGNYMSIINSAPAGTGFWVLWDAASNIYLVTFPPRS